MKNKLIFPLMFAGLTLFSACDPDADSDRTVGTAKMDVRMTDAPGDYEEVNVEVVSVQVHKEDTDGESGWMTLDEINPGVYNLLEFANGKDTLLASSTLPAGKISQIRLILGDENTVKLKDGSIIDLKTPSGQTSGVKLKVNAELEADVTYTMLLDFDAAKSVVAKGNGGYNLKPVIRVISQAVAGGIRGKVTPAELKPGIYVISAANDTLGGFANEAGDFLFKGVKAGTYSVQFYVEGDSTVNTKVENVMVTENAIKDLGTIELSE